MGFVFGGTSTFAPVLGLRPTRPRRCRVRKLPKPRISILSPLLERFDDAVENGFDDGLRVGAFELGDALHLLDEVGLRQRELLGHRAFASLQSQSISGRRFMVRNGLGGMTHPFALLPTLN